MLKNMLTIPGSIVYIIGGPIRPLNERMNLHFDREYDIYLSFENCERHGYGHDLGLLIISH